MDAAVVGRVTFLRRRRHRLDPARTGCCLAGRDCYWAVAGAHCLPAVACAGPFDAVVADRRRRRREALTAAVDAAGAAADLSEVCQSF